MSSEIRLIAIVTVNGEDFIRGLRMEPHGTGVSLMDEAGKLCMDIAHLINKEGGQSESSGEPI